MYNAHFFPAEKAPKIEMRITVMKQGESDQLEIIYLSALNFTLTLKGLLDYAAIKLLEYSTDHYSCR